MSSSLSIYRSIYLPIFLSICLSICMSIYPSTFLPIKNEANLPDFPNFSNWQHQKPSNYAKLPQVLSLTTSKTQQFIETSSIFALHNVKKRRNSARRPHFSKVTTSKTKQFCETSFKNGKLSAELTASCRCALRFLIPSVCDFSFHLCPCVCAPATKVRPGHMKCPTRHAKSS